MITPLEQDVLDLLVCGLSNPTIASILAISRLAVVNRLQGLYNKLGFSNRIELALWYNQQLPLGTYNQK